MKTGISTPFIYIPIKRGIYRGRLQTVQEWMQRLLRIKWVMKYECARSAIKESCCHNTTSRRPQLTWVGCSGHDGSVDISSIIPRWGLYYYECSGGWMESVRRLGGMSRHSYCSLTLPPRANWMGLLGPNVGQFLWKSWGRDWGWCSCSKVNILGF